MSLKVKKIKEMEEKLEQLWNSECRAEDCLKVARTELHSAESMLASIKQDILETEEWLAALKEE